MHVHPDHNHDSNHDHNTCCGHVTGGAGHNVVNPHEKGEGEGKVKGRAHKALLWSGIIAGGSHIFCCVLPGLLSALALLSNFGIIVTLPGWVEGLHEVMHDWELPVIAFSGVIVAIGWAAYFYSKYNDCHDHGCDHNSCQPRKVRAGRILLLASALFMVNVAVYVGAHSHNAATEDSQPHDEHGH